ncbi:MAG: hypothetical protein AB7F78_25820, partial [Hyphomicrobiaceae bacterium]
AMPRILSLPEMLSLGMVFGEFEVNAAFSLWADGRREPGLFESRAARRPRFRSACGAMVSTVLRGLQSTVMDRR